MLSIERLLVLVEQYIITVEVMLFLWNHTHEITYKCLLELTTSECKCQVYKGRGRGIIHPSSLHPFVF